MYCLYPELVVVLVVWEQASYSCRLIHVRTLKIGIQDRSTRGFTWMNYPTTLYIEFRF
jgi:hypothetical protein